MKKLKLGAAILCAMMAMSVTAGPAPYYLWRSKANPDKTVCLQTSPGSGWEKDAGPYKDSKCNQ